MMGEVCKTEKIALECLNDDELGCLVIMCKTNEH